MKFNFKKLEKEKKQGLLMILIGFVFMSVFAGYRFHQARILSFFAQEEIPQVVTQRTGEIPVYIKSYPLGIDIKISEASIKEGVWQVFPDAVSHLDNSARIGEGGNIIIYGHNKDDVLGPIRFAKVGEKIELFDASGNKYLYEVFKIDTVEPNDLTYILPTNKEILTIYTCTGFLDSKRYIAVAKKIIDNLANNQTYR